MVLFVKLGALDSRDELGTAWISRFLRSVVCKVLCLCLPLGLPDGPNPRGVPSAPCRNHAPTRDEEGSYIRSERSERSNEQPSLTENNLV